MLSTINRKRHLGQECLTMADKDFSYLYRQVFL